MDTRSFKEPLTEEGESTPFLAAEHINLVSTIKRPSSVASGLNTFLVFVCIFLFTTSTWLYYWPTDQNCLRKLNTPSPLFEVVEYVDLQFNTSNDEPTQYRGWPSIEREILWHQLYRDAMFELPASDLAALHKDPDGPADNKDWVRTKNGGFMVGIDMHHSIHCINMLRQTLYRDVWDYSDEPYFKQDWESVRDHAAHCVEVLRSRILCYADTTPYLHIKVPRENEFSIAPDLATQHRCPRLEPINNWIQNHRISVDDLEFKPLDPEHTG